jgi:hypothetical protein
MPEPRLPPIVGLVHLFAAPDKLRIVGSSALDCPKAFTSSGTAPVGMRRWLVLTQRGFHPKKEASSFA